MDEVDVWIDDACAGVSPVRVGQLRASVARGHTVVRFRYDESWLEAGAGGFAIDPGLPMGAGDFFPPTTHTLHGALRDRAPDRWGRRLMDRREREEAKRVPRSPRTLTDWDYLLGVQDVGRLGALRLRDVESGSWLDDRSPGIPPIARLRELEAAAMRLDSEPVDTVDPAIAVLIEPGSSLGGARPKATFTDLDGSLWLAKFPSREDRFDVGAAEYLLHQLARACGISVPDARIERLGRRGSTFCVKRFDRDSGQRRMYWSAMTLIQGSDGDDASYLDVAEALQNHGDIDGAQLDLHQLYRRALFNILVGNRDDHLRNHGLLRGPTGWRLAPAFDLNPEIDRLEHALSIDESDPRPLPESLRATARYYRLDISQAEAIERDVRKNLADWRDVAHRIGMNRGHVERLATVVLPSGL